ncbi:MAG: hypothetical protein ACE5KJ_02315 [Candidatus Zixiibacteriota bacterium]
MRRDGGSKTKSPFICFGKKSRTTEICDVDILILKNGKIRAIFEIEESDVTPNQICGKFLTSTLASLYINRNHKPHDSILFIQILNTYGLQRESKKIKQWKAIEEAIQGVIPIKGSKIDKYKILTLRGPG